MDDLSRSEYPAMLANLHPNQAVQALSDRIKRISKVNQEIADWLQERRRVEEQYVNGLRKLLVFKVPNNASELGVFQQPWDKILQSTDNIAASHQLFAQRIEKDVEHALRSFQNKKEMQNIHTIGANLHTMARELDDAQEKSDKLTRKGAKANSQKVDQAASRLESANQQWDSQAPFIFETLQALDEQRVNHLRDVLTQFETHEVDQATRTQAAAEDVLNTMLEVSTVQEIQNFAQRTIAGRPKLERRTGTGSGTRQSSIHGGSTLVPPSASGHEDDMMSEHSGNREGQSESRLRSRIGTMLGRRRQSIHGGFGPISPQKSLGPFTRNLGSSHGISPRASSHNLAESHNRLSSLAERPTTAEREGTDEGTERALDTSHEGTNGITNGANGTNGNISREPEPVQSTSNILSRTPEDIFDAPPPPGPPPSHQKAQEPTKDADGFTIPAPMNDPISQAQKEAAAEEADQFFKLNIQKEPIAEEDQNAKQAALSNVANTLSHMGMPTRKSGTVRGRRDVRNTIYMPALPVPENGSENPFPPSPSLPTLASFRPTPATTFASETSVASVASDTQSVRSGTTSLGGASSYSGIARLKHPDMHGPGFGPGLHSSIIETVSAHFEDGVAKSVKVTGEVALSYTPDHDSSHPGYETIRLNNFAQLDSIGPNRLIATNNGSSPDEFTLEVSHLSPATPAFTYRLHAANETALASQCPIAIQPVWKPQGDKLGLLLQYRLNPAFASTLPRPVTLSNVVFVVTYEGARASGVQTKPSGTHLKDKHLVYWRLGDVTLREDWTKIICRVIGEQNAEPHPGHVEVRWDYSVPQHVEGVAGISVSRLVDSGKGKEKAEEEEEDDPFADDKGPLSPGLAKDQRTWADVPLIRRLVSGKYEAK
ncbi:Muniscin C-terminal mu homology domain-containing protein [Diplogelasinospora grovesii]|uniref:Muniscin C-terminal mu homology domain-containing protein n=1 Tax=Diplogelasinospora grovesii TaxID=303347 RepID=A0AAN6S202_9PEZI|nr:Muniscin C-terminal mu homology domain-containing protein [Diplogelasinospora grovesii]